MRTRLPGLRTWLVALWLTLAVAAALPGLRYYATPLQERAFAAGDSLFAPTGVVGHSLGVVGSLFMVVGVAMYSLRRRWPRLAGAGRLSSWLQVHIFLCTLGPFLVLLHTAFKIGGLVAIAFWSMLVVVVSGVFGRYVYVRIPRTIHGRVRTLDAMETERQELALAIQTHSGIPAHDWEAALAATRPAAVHGILAGLAAAVRHDLAMRSHMRSIRRLLDRERVPPAVREPLLLMAREQFRTEQQIALLRPFQRLFHYWHVFHLPLAIVMFLILAIHVAVAAMFGYGWPF